MSMLRKLLPEEKLIKFIETARGIDSPPKKYLGLIDPSTTDDPIFQVVIEMLSKKIAVSYTQQGVNKIVDDPSVFKHQQDLVDKHAAYKPISEMINTNFSESDLEIVGKALHSSAMGYLRKTYKKWYDVIKSDCKMIERKEAPVRASDGSIQMRQLSLEIGWNSKIEKYEIFYNPVFMARGSMEEVFGEIMELSGEADFSKLDVTYIYDWLTVISCFYIMHELFHANFDEVKTFSKDSRDLAHIDKSAKNIINDFYINNQLQEIFSNNVYINRIYADVLGKADRKLTMKTGYADFVYFTGKPSSEIAIDTESGIEAKSIETIINNITSIVEHNITQPISNSFDYKPLSIKDEDFVLNISDQFKIALSANVVEKSGGIRSSKDFYNTCKELVKYLFAEAPKARTSSVTVTIDDETGSGDPPPPEDAESIFVPFPEGTIVKINATGEVAGVYGIKVNPDGTFTYIVNKANKKLTEAREEKVPSGWEITDDLIGEFNANDLTVVKLPPQREGSDSGSPQPQPPQDSDQQQPSPTKPDKEGEEGEPGEGEGAGEGEPGKGEEGEPGEGEGAGEGEEDDKTPKPDDKKYKEEDIKDEDASPLPDNEAEKRKAKRKLSDIASEVKDELDMSDTVLDSTIDPLSDLKQRAEEQALKAWKQLLRKKISEALGIDLHTDLDSYNRRLQGRNIQTGKKEMIWGEEIFETTLEDICFCFDISVSMSVRTHYGYILDFLDVMFKMNGIKFKRVGMSFFAGSYVATKLTRLAGKKTAQIASNLAGKYVDELAGGTDEAQVLAPFLPGGEWVSARPSITVVFTDGAFNGGGIPPSHKSWLKKMWGKNLIIVIAPGGSGVDYTTPEKKFTTIKKENIIKIKGGKS